MIIKTSIYLFLCMLNALVIATAGINVTTHWQAWISIFCVVGAYVCGLATNEEDFKK